jgi:hypothetical protein
MLTLVLTLMLVLIAVISLTITIELSESRFLGPAAEGSKKGLLED